MHDPGSYLKANINSCFLLIYRKNNFLSAVNDDTLLKFKQFDFKTLLLCFQIFLMQFLATEQRHWISPLLTDEKDFDFIY